MSGFEGSSDRLGTSSVVESGSHSPFTFGLATLPNPNKNSSRIGFSCADEGKKMQKEVLNYSFVVYGRL